MLWPKASPLDLDLGQAFQLNFHHLNVMIWRLHLTYVSVRVVTSETGLLCEISWLVSHQSLFKPNGFSAVQIL